MEKKVLTTYSAGVWFIHRLPLSTTSKLIRKLEIDTKDPDTIDYKKVLEHVIKQTASDKAIQQMNSTQNPSQQQTEVVDQIVKQLRPTVSVTKEQRLADLVVKPTKPVSLPDTAVDQLTKAFEKLSVNLLQQVQRPPTYPPAGPYRRYPHFTGQQSSVNYPEALKGLQNEDPPSVNVEAYTAGSQGAFGRQIGVCWYCFNQNPLYQDPPHRFRD
jgi:hypothetical protein